MAEGLNYVIAVQAIGIYASSRVKPKRDDSKSYTSVIIRRKKYEPTSSAGFDGNRA
jgi:hypothetical protein